MRGHKISLEGAPALIGALAKLEFSPHYIAIE